jgi:hypothetical protein
MQYWVFAVPLGAVLIPLGFRLSKSKNIILGESVMAFGFLWFAWNILCWEMQAIPEVR